MASTAVRTLEGGLSELRETLMEAEAALYNADAQARRLHQEEERWAAELPRFGYIVAQGLHSISSQLGKMSGSAKPAQDLTLDLVIDSVEELSELVECARARTASDV